MAGRSALLTRSGTQTLISWISREDATERFERAANGDLADGYLPDATPESLARAGVPMQWTGTAAHTLGLQGEASPKAAARVLTHGLGPHGEKLRTAIKAMPRKDPRTGEAIPQERRDTMGWVLSAPKTISLLLASEHPAVRMAAREALDLASDVALHELEQQVTVRRGAQGVRSEGIQGLAGVKAMHFTSSAGDPHLHVHYILNTSAPAQSDGKWRALDGNVLFAAQRVAEAAFQATLKAELTRRLTVDPQTAWHKMAVGSVPTWELAALLPAVERFSHAMAHMQDIAKKIATTLGGETRAQHDLIWALHRQDKHAIAEALEHAMDAAIAQGGQEATALRTEWRHWLGEHQDALDPIATRPRIQDLPSHSATVARIRGIFDGSRATQHAEARRQADHAAAQTQIALDNFRAGRVLWDGGTQRIPDTEFRRLEEALHSARQVKFAWVFHRTDKATLQRIQQQLADYHEFNRRWDANQAAQQHARTIREHTGKADTADHQLLQEIRSRAAEMGNRLGPFIAADVIADWRGWGVSLAEARQLAADTLRFWHTEGLLHIPEGVEPETLFQTIAAGRHRDTQQNWKVLGHNAKLVSADLLQREMSLYQQAIDLSQTQRQWLAVEVAGLTPDQAKAAATIAGGKALTTVQGVAGAGKTHMMKPVVAAAQAQGLDVLVLARNAKLAHELGAELHVPSSTLARWSHRQHPASRPTLLILDEAGLVDQRNWQAVLDHAAREPIQVVALGDRYQAQPIDRLASWAVVTNATQHTGSYAELSQTFRNQSWAPEAGHLRDGDATAIDLAHAAQRIWAAPDGHGPAQAAEMVLKLTQRHEDALAIAATNEDAAAIAEAIQRRREITVDPRTHLRWGQHTGVGDQVRTRKNERQEAIQNGDRWTVQQITDHGLLLQGPTGRIARVSHQWAKDHLELAYAATVDSAQGVTVDRAVVLVGPGMGHTRLYSAATRGRQAPVYIAESVSHATAAERIRHAVRVNDLAPTMQEILTQQHRQALRETRVPRSEPVPQPQRSEPIAPPTPQRQGPPQPLPSTPPVRVHLIGGRPKAPSTPPRDYPDPEIDRGRGR